MTNTTFGLSRFAVARFMCGLTDQFLLYVVPLAIFKSTQDVKYSGLAFLIEWLPRIVFFPLAGYFVDRLNARQLFGGVEIGRALVLIVAIILLACGGNIFVILSSMMALLSVAYILNLVGSEALLTRNLKIDELPKAYSMLQGVDQVTQILGPALAVGLSVWGGLSFILMVGAGMFSLSSLLLVGLRSNPLENSQRHSLFALLESNRVAFQVLVENRILFLLSALTWVVNLIYGAALVISVSIVLKFYSLSEAHFGFLQGSAAIISIVTFLFLPGFAKKYGISAVGLVSFCLMIFSGLLLSFPARYEIYFVGYAVLMAFDGGFSIYIRTVRSQFIPEEHLGKTVGLMSLMNMCSIPMSAAAVTLLSTSLSPFEIFGVIFSVSAILGMALVWFGRRSFGYSTWLPATKCFSQTLNIAIKK